MNWSGISDKSLHGRVLRFLLSLIPKRMKLPVIQGRLKGKKWIVGSGNHGCWLGSYEYEKQRLFGATVADGSTVFDLGGHVGFYTLLASELVGSKGKVFVFEPAPRNIFYIKEHLRLNHVKNVTVIEAAVSDRCGTVSFHLEEEARGFLGHIASDGRFQVKTVALDELISRGELPIPDYIKIDIEGAEMMALLGAKSLLAKAHPVIFLATHGSGVHQECCRLLKSLGYELQPIDGMNLEESSEVLADYRRSPVSRIGTL